MSKGGMTIDANQLAWLTRLTHAPSDSRGRYTLSASDFIDLTRLAAQALLADDHLFEAANLAADNISLTAERDALKAELEAALADGPELVEGTYDDGERMSVCSGCQDDVEKPHTWKECHAANVESENRLHRELIAAEQALRTLREASRELLDATVSWDDDTIVGRARVGVAAALAATAPPSDGAKETGDG